APVVGSGCCQAWMARVSKRYLRSPADMALSFVSTPRGRGGPLIAQRRILEGRARRGWRPRANGGRARRTADDVEEGADALDLHLDPIAGAQGTDTGRRPRGEEVSGLERHHPRDEGDQRGHRMDHVARVAVLAELAVHAAADRQAKGIAPSLRDPRPDRAEGVEALGAREVLFPPLDVARGDVVEAGEAEDDGGDLRLGDVPAAAADHHR